MRSTLLGKDKDDGASPTQQMVGNPEIAFRQPVGEVPDAIVQLTIPNPRSFQILYETAR